MYQVLVNDLFFLSGGKEAMGRAGTSSLVWLISSGKLAVVEESEIEAAVGAAVLALEVEEEEEEEEEEEDSDFLDSDFFEKNEESTVTLRFSI